MFIWHFYPAGLPTHHRAILPDPQREELQHRRGGEVHGKLSHPGTVITSPQVTTSSKAKLG